MIPSRTTSVVSHGEAYSEVHKHVACTRVDGLVATLCIRKEQQDNTPRNSTDEFEPLPQHLDHSLELRDHAAGKRCCWNCCNSPPCPAIPSQALVCRGNKARNDDLTLHNQIQKVTINEGWQLRNYVPRSRSAGVGCPRPTLTAGSLDLTGYAAVVRALKH